MARGKNKKSTKSKSGLLPAEEEIILGMKPLDLTVELTFEQNAIEALKEQRKEEVSTLANKVKEFDKALNNTKEVAEAQEALRKSKEENMDPDHLEAKEDLAALRQGFSNDLKFRSKRVKFIRKTLKHHIESGALKRKQ